MDPLGLTSGFETPLRDACKVFISRVTKDSLRFFHFFLDSSYFRAGHYSSLIAWSDHYSSLTGSAYWAGEGPKRSASVIWRLE
jgi:hypothetical protein